MKAAMISIRPEWCEKIASGEKTVEVRKTRPKIEPPFKCYIYCTKAKEKLWVSKGSERAFTREKIAAICQAKDVGGAYQGNGKVIGEFVCDKIDYWNHHIHDDDTITLERASELSRVSEDDLVKYADLGHFYAWKISDLVIYDTPKDLTSFYQKCKSYPKDDWEYDDCLLCENPCGNGGKLYLKRPPQSWCYVEEGGE